MIRANGTSLQGMVAMSTPSADFVVPEFEDYDGTAEDKGEALLALLTAVLTFCRIRLDTLKRLLETEILSQSTALKLEVGFKAFCLRRLNCIDFFIR